MNVRSQKKLAAKIMKVGLYRVKVTQEKELEEAITRNDVKRLIARGVITKVDKRGPRKKESKFRRGQKEKGRRTREGSRKGKAYSKKSSKTHWAERVRPLRKLLRELRDSGKIKKNDYRKLYSMVKGGAFRSKKHLLYHLKEKELIKKKKGVKSEKK
ncbi:MAG: 50S ribosomal protein L19e [Candidatus Aenigmatarchaeota archaeon]|nr:MAG: 50S ribosomal protein L19e [Candidatus Aenigmarchaeota archaeon]